MYSGFWSIFQCVFDILSSIKKLKKADKQHHDAGRRYTKSKESSADNQAVNPAVNGIQFRAGVYMLATVSGVKSAPGRAVLGLGAGVSAAVSWALVFANADLALSMASAYR